ncbi:GGDEF domain-containing protein [Microvirga rosea]|uniref:GGDEF domain-containing protein n=1 Tax=Microvirga rosea TaxID=2715425 RepID=UPI001D09B9AC|nr:GGDEF domain-containing protein [Microvirga rosea]MCB8820045.1 GGDEF domain-containing protein [Microvirga rosea]
MKLDLPTLSAVFVQITAVLGLLLLFSWTLNRKVQALAWWGSAFLLILTAIGLVVFQEGKPTTFILLVANSSLALAYGVLYTGCRVFNGRQPTWLSIMAGVGLWCVAFLMILNDTAARLAIMSGIGAVYAGLSAWELWRHARQRLASQLIAIFLLTGLVVFNIFRGVSGFSLAHAFWVEGYTQRGSAQMAMLLATFMPTLAFVFLSMAKEQIEYDHKHAALIDALTGIANRRAFFEASNALLAKRAGPVSCLLFDLDNFKGVNDRFGHEVGDHVLVIFGRVLADHLPRGIFGRLGGEEFAAMVPLGAAEAQDLAETIRHSFSSVGKIVLGQRVEVTVSVGCVTATQSSVQHLLRQADAALYRAKAGGRNLVATFSGAES